jgi:hypothetical protein
MFYSKLLVKCDYNLILDTSLNLRAALFCGIMQHWVVILYWCFGTTYYMPWECRSHQHCGRSLNSLIFFFAQCVPHSWVSGRVKKWLLTEHSLSAHAAPHVILRAGKDLIYASVTSFSCSVFKICLADDISVHLSNSRLDGSMKRICRRFSQVFALLPVLLNH